MIPLGFYPGQPNGNDANAMAAYKAAIAADVALLGPQSVIGVFEQGVGQNPGTSFWSIKQAGAQSLRVVDGVPMRKGADALQATINGQDDPYYKGIVQVASANNLGPIDLRLGYEPNVPNMASQVSNVTDAAAFVKAFQHIYTITHEEAARLNVPLRVGFNPAMIHDFPISPKLMYPGNAFCDVLMLDIYGSIADPGEYHQYQVDYSGPTVWNPQMAKADWIASAANRRKSWMHHPGNYWNWTGISGANATLNPDWSKTTQGWSFAEHIHFALACGKPIAIPETGCGPVSNGMLFTPDDGEFPKWLAEALAWAQSLGVTVDYVNIWDINPGDGNWKFSGGAQPNVAAAWKAGFGATRDLVINLSEDAFQGDAVAQISVNGKAQGVTVTASHSGGKTQPITIPSVSTGSKINILFSNDKCAQNPDGSWNASLGDRNLYVDGAQWGSLDLDIAPVKLLRTGDNVNISV